MEKKADDLKEKENDLVLSYMTLRNLIGFSGFLLPLFLIFFTKIKDGDCKIQGSISDYFYTSTGDVLVLTLCVTCVFLITYNGYGGWEKLLMYLSAIGGLGVAFSPTTDKHCATSSVHTHMLDGETAPMIFGVERHLIFAGMFFISLALISIIFFPKTKPGEMVQKGSQKAKRNWVYRISGWGMLICVAVIIIHEIVSDHKEKSAFIFWGETVALFLFAFSWLTKGETLWPDDKHYIVRGYKMAKAKLKKDDQSKLKL
jgi:hypothetical protein